ncbi:MAG: dTMP kinase [Fidelibacterota bacterium]|nr:MAG: dTMP kinase [Candidatus Neomarinimicrobiota bacterium]
MAGIFITFEGIDGSGKSTQIALLKRRFEELGRTVVVVREPGGTALSEKIRTLLLDHRNQDLCERAEALLFSTARAQLVHEVIIPALERGDVVLCDRYAESTVAYQGYARELPLDEIITTQEFATYGLRPALKVLLDLDVDVAASRLLGSYADRMESAGRAFQERVRQGYLKLAQANPSEWLVVDGSQPVEKIAQEVGSYVEEHIITDS